jgi:acylphosphatase
MKELRRYLISGRVQGVGFRAFVWREAGALEVDGWVRNRFDGSVEALAAAEPAEHDRLRAILERGPRMSRVDSVEVSDVELDVGIPGGFEIRPDA